MSLFSHLQELRSRLVKAFLGIFTIAGISLTYSDKIMNFLKAPLVQALPPGVSALHFTGPMEVFMVSMKVCFIFGFVMSCPIWLYQFWKFIEPALYEKERKYVLPFAVTSIILFFSGIAFCYYLMLPFSLKYMIGLGMEVGTPIITITDYVSMISILIFGFGIVFEIPLILVLLGFLGVVDAATLAKHRGPVLVVVMIISAVMTPPDPVSLMMMSIPMYAMYELSIVLIRMFIRKKDRS